MKKLNLLIALLLIVAAGAFADDMMMSVTPSAELSGDASVTFGADLDNGYTGIANDSSSDLTITFVESSTKEKGEGAVVGWIELADFAASANNSDGLTITPPRRFS